MVVKEITQGKVTLLNQQRFSVLSNLGQHTRTRTASIRSLHTDYKRLEREGENLLKNLKFEEAREKLLSAIVKREECTLLVENPDQGHAQWIEYLKWKTRIIKRYLKGDQLTKKERKALRI